MDSRYRIGNAGIQSVMFINKDGRYNGLPNRLSPSVLRSLLLSWRVNSNDSGRRITHDGKLCSNTGESMVGALYDLTNNGSDPFPTNVVGRFSSGGLFVHKSF